MTSTFPAERRGPLYYSGRKAQQKLILLWLEESFKSKEPIDPTLLTIEHVLPQTPTEEWKELVEPGLPPDEDFATAHAAAVHTLGNLTLTGYNSELSNNPWTWKKAELGKSGLRLNQEIAGTDHWTLAAIRARGKELAERAIALWPGPDPDADKQPEKLVWVRLNQVMSALPPGAWTTYGDVAAVIGSHQVAVGQRLAAHDVPNAYRVLQAGGTVSPGFHWTDPSITADPRDLLAAEGVRFDTSGRAIEDQRMSASELAALSGLSIDGDELSDILSGATDHSADRMPQFLEQLAAAQTPEVVDAVTDLLKAWTDLGGTVEFGRAQQTSCFLMARQSTNNAKSLWPATIYPEGKVEVVFEHLAVRPPFDDSDLRLQFLQRLNQAPGIELPEAKISLRPGFAMQALTDEQARIAVIEALAWFLQQCSLADPPPDSLG